MGNIKVNRKTNYKINKVKNIVLSKGKQEKMRNKYGNTNKRLKHTLQSLVSLQFTQPESLERSAANQQAEQGTKGVSAN